ncbi:hypothetical protein NCCP2495_01890 [Dietzia sp. NCCP-2495]|nr:hypothetical protein NCCP2495_01890 [Dietzia sp. NCCP-2495]
MVSGTAARVSPLRSWGTVVISMVSSVVLVLGILWGYAPFDSLRPTSEVTSMAHQEPCEIIGMAGNAQWDDFSDAEYGEAIRTTREIGMGRVRIGANWAEIETSPGNYDWSELDMRINHARNAGLQPLLVIQTVPGWITPPSGPITDEHRQFAAKYGDFAGAIADRYGNDVNEYEIWNEPNLHKFWPNPNVEHYVKLLKAAYGRIHAADPHATVITGGLAPAPDGSQTIAPLTFLDRLYELGGGDFSDAIGMHPYSYPELPSGDSEWNTFRSLTDVVNLMATHGDGDKKVWLTEYGAPTGGSSGVSPKLQAQMVAEAYELAAAHRSIGPIFIYTLIDGGAPNGDPERYFGLYYENQTPKPAVAALQDAISNCVPGTGTGSVGAEAPIIGQPTSGGSGGGFGS